MRLDDYCLGAASELGRSEPMSLDATTPPKELPNVSLDLCQTRQRQHDEGYHQDILGLPLHQRMNHMALHMAKYTAHFLDAAARGDEGKRSATVVDAFIITLASANALCINLVKEIGEQKNDRVQEAFARLAISGFGQGQFWFAHEFARLTGRLAKACESQDHAEVYPIEQVMRDSVLEFGKLLLREAGTRNIDLVKQTRARWKAVEEKAKTRAAATRTNKA